MSIAKTIVSRPTTFLIIYALIVGMAIYVTPKTPIDLLPSIDVPNLSIVTTYKGAGPQEVEQTVTRPIEGVLTNITGLKKILSTSSEGTSRISLELKWGTDLTEATNEVRDKLEFIRGTLPKETGSPQIFKFNSSDIPILYMSVASNRSTDEIYSIAKNQIQPRLEQIDGVAMVALSGGRERAIRLEVSRNRLDAYGLTLSQVSKALASQNIQTGSGEVYEGNLRYQVETDGLFNNLEDIKNAVVSYKDSAGTLQPIRLRDFAEVLDFYKDETSSVYINGKRGIFIEVKKQSGTNTVKVADNIKAKINDIQSFLPAGVELVILYDSTKIIRQSLKDVLISAITGALLAMIVLLVFLRSLRSTFVIGLSIPISLITTLMAMYFAGITLNIMTLTGLTLGIGMIVDSSIVILENIYRYREKGAKAIPAALLGSQEMITAISASILTTVAIFIPLLLFKNELEIFGVIFRDLALTVVFALLCSLAIAITLTPVLSCHYFTLYTRKQRPIRSRILAFMDQHLERMFQSADNAYKRFLSHILDHRILTGLIILLILILSFFTLEPLGGNVGVEFFPNGGEDVVTFSMTMPEGTRLEVSRDILIQLGDIAREEIKGYKDIFFQVESGGGQLFISLPARKQRIETAEEIREKLRVHFNNFPSAKFNTSSENQSDSAPIDILVRSGSLALGLSTANEIKELLENNVEEVRSVHVNFVEGRPTARISIDRNKAYSLGLNMASVAEEISTAVGGTSIGRYRSGGEEIDILLLLKEEDRNSIPDLDSIFVINQKGLRIPISSFARIRRVSGPIAINREDRSRAIHVRAQQKAGLSLNTVDSAVRYAVRSNIVLEEGVTLSFLGDFAELTRAGKKFAVVLLVAMALVYGIMASLFESLKNPFIIFLSIFMIIPGILFLYSLMNIPFFGVGSPLSLFSAVGVLMLVGISVNNGIVLVDYTNLLVHRGRTIREAIIEAGGNRLRPILMTSLTTILGMVPLAFNTGEGAGLVRPIGQTIVGGMMMSTLMSLFLVPILYDSMNRKKKIAQMDWVSPTP